MSGVFGSPGRGVRLGLAFGGLLLAGAGCTRSDGLAVHPVSGSLRVNGKPAPAAVLTFHPVAEAGSEPVRPTARTGPDGTFKLTTRAEGDGAPAGEYRVTVSWFAPAVGKRPVEGDDGAARALLPDKYSRPETSPLRAVVRPGDNEPITIEISTAKR